MVDQSDRSARCTAMINDACVTPDWDYPQARFGKTPVEATAATGGVTTLDSQPPGGWLALWPFATPRVITDGVLLEPQATNLIGFNVVPSAWAYQGLKPDVRHLAELIRDWPAPKLVPNVGKSASSEQPALDFGRCFPDADQTYVASCLARAGEAAQVSFDIPQGQILFNLATGKVAGGRGLPPTVGLIPLANGVFRLWAWSRGGPQAWRVGVKGQGGLWLTGFQVEHDHLTSLIVNLNKGPATRTADQLRVPAPMGREQVILFAKAYYAPIGAPWLGGVLGDAAGLHLSPLKVRPVGPTIVPMDVNLPWVMTTSAEAHWTLQAPQPCVVRLSRYRRLLSEAQVFAALVRGF